MYESRSIQKPVRILQHPATVFDPLDATALLTALAWLRPFAAFGQALAIVAVLAGLHVSLPLAPLLAEIAVLLLAGAAAFWRLTRTQPVGELEAVAHVALDVLLLGWALYFTGGASNPFMTLLLVPVALAATTLSLRSIAVVLALALLVYGILMAHYVPLPDISTHSGAGFRLHLTGMAINFLIAALLLAAFLGRVTALLRQQRKTTRGLRERALRDEGILAVATQAATAAHELNTPLSTLLATLPDLAEAQSDDPALQGDLQLMVREVERCRDALHRMVEYGQRQLSDQPETTRLGPYLQGNADRFRLLCPAARLRVTVPAELADYAFEVQPSLAHAILSLMQNAYDASSRNSSRVVTLGATVRDGRIEFVVADRGAGFTTPARHGGPGTSNKPNGLGIGLALARATVERLRGELRAQSDSRGTRIRVCIPVTHGGRS